MNDKTTILIKKEIRDALKKKRKYSRETYDEILNRELKLKLSPQDQKTYNEIKKTKRRLIWAKNYLIKE